MRPGWKSEKPFGLSTARELERKGAPVGEAVESAAASVSARLDPILGLVEEGAGLLARGKIGDQLHLSLQEFDGPGIAPAEHPLALLQSFMSANAHVVALDDRPRREQALEKVGEELAPSFGRLDQRLYAQAVGVAVDDQAGQQIGLAVHEAARAVAGRVGEGDVAQSDGL